MGLQNYYSGGWTNRMSWMRQSGSFLASALASPNARFILFRNLRPLVSELAGSAGDLSASYRLATFPWHTLSSILDPTGAPVLDPRQVIDHSGGIWPHQLAARTKHDEHLALDRYPTIIFLGSNGATQQPEPTDSAQPAHGSPVWAVDVSGLYERHAQLLTQDGQFEDLKSVVLEPKEATLAAEARAMIDWNTRNRFCGGCGRPTYSIWAGWKLACAADVERESAVDEVPQAWGPCRPACPTTKPGIQNYSYPRTDPVCIMAITNATGDSILLGRKKIWPAGFYSCLAGFIEPGESIEDSCRREVLEESGVKVEEVYYHSSQPWPFPGSLMIGVIGQAEANPQFRFDLDKELEDARFFPRSLICQVLEPSRRVELTAEELKTFDDGYEPSAQEQLSSTDCREQRAAEKLQLKIPPPVKWFFGRQSLEVVST